MNLLFKDFYQNIFLSQHPFSQNFYIFLSQQLCIIFKFLKAKTNVTNFKTTIEFNQHKYVNHKMIVVAYKNQKHLLMSHTENSIAFTTSTIFFDSNTHLFVDFNKNTNKELH